jgi:DNA-directed RNA polymerase specialized sigma24 family protein
LPQIEDPFDALLAWLDPDRDIAAQRLLTIRTGLTRIFISKGCDDAEHLADIVVDRVSKRLPEIRETYVGEPAAYFHGVARYVILEKCRPRETPTDEVPVVAIKITTRSDEYECLLRCLQFLDRKKRELILDYHVYEGHDKIVQHEIMAHELGISEGALRCRAHQIRAKLEECVLKCKQNLRKETKPTAGSILNGGSGNHGGGRTKQT